MKSKLWFAFAITMSIVQVVAATHWSITDAVWSGGLFKFVWLLGLLLAAMTACLTWLVLLVFRGLDGVDRTKIAEGIEDFRKAAEPKLRRKVLGLADGVAITALAIGGHPWWAFLYLCQCGFERLWIRGSREIVKAIDKGENTP